MQFESARERFWLPTLVALVAVVLFLLMHPYSGMVHDARLYTLQALNHLHPELYGNDVFVRFGSQDDFTLFSPLYSAMIALVGVEPAAAGLTFAAICLFATAAWMLARTLLPVWQSAAAMLLMLLVPPVYGPDDIFRFIETFVTPRQLSEALALFSITAWFRHRRFLAASLIAAAMLVHPIMGLSGIIFLLVLEWIVPRWQMLWPVALLSGLCAALAWIGWLPVSRWQFDAEWHEIVMRRTYLGLGSWDEEDWGHVVKVLATLGVASFFLRDLLQRIAAAALLTATGLILISVVGGDLLRIVIVVQAQLWRVLWLASVLSVVLLPPLFVQGWRAGPLARCALLLIAGAWCAHYGTPSLIAASLAMMAAAFASRAISAPSAWLLMWGSWGVLILILASHLATSLQGLNDGLSQSVSLSTWFDRLRTFLRPGIIPGLLLIAGGYLVRRVPSRLTFAALSLTALSCLTLFAPESVSTWTTGRFTGALQESFAPWRSRIAPGSDVMWVSDETPWGDGATNTWLLLQRPSFLAGAQAPNALFSRTAAIEMRNRAQAMWGLLPFADPFRPRGEQNSALVGPLRLRPVCETTGVNYVVTSGVAIDAVPIAAPPAAPPELRKFKLYICT
jgi:hypothetical protein